MTDEKNLWQEDDLVRDLKAYGVALGKPLAIGAGLLVALYLITSLSFLDWTIDLTNNVTWVIKVGVMAAAIWRLTGMYRQHINHGLAVGAVAGVTLGIASALCKLIWFFNYWLLANLLVEPILSGAIGLLLGFIMIKAIQIKNKMNRDDESRLQEK